MSTFSKGQRVTWLYRHYLNRGSSVLRSKIGTFSHYHKQGGIKTGLCVVRFDGNKTDSRVPGSELRPMEASDE